MLAVVAKAAGAAGTGPIAPPAVVAHALVAAGPVCVGATLLGALRAIVARRALVAVLAIGASAAHTCAILGAAELSRGTTELGHMRRGGVGVMRRHLHCQH